MRALTLLLLCSSVYIVYSTKNDVRSLTEQMGQEVIEMGGNIKELPPDIDEEPSAESAEDTKVPKAKTPASIPVKKDVKKTTQNVVKTMPVETRRRGKDIDKIDKDGLSAEEAEEEDRIEKEFADLYKDTADYKDSGETKENATKTSSVMKKMKTEVNSTEKAILRARTNFQFQPDSYNSKDVERFRTSIDEISCGRRVTKLAEVVAIPSSSAVNFAQNYIIFGLATCAISFRF